MANQKNIINWFIKNHERIGLKVNKVNWPRKWWPEVSDYEVHSTINSVQSIGRGIDINSELAFTKACVESVERYVCSAENINSNGLAFHANLFSCQEHAKRELIERKVIKKLFASREALQDLNYEDFGLGDLGIRLNNNSAQLLLKKVIVDELVIVLSCIVSSKRFDHNELFLGFSCGKDESTVARKAVSESVVSYTAINLSLIHI